MKRRTLFALSALSLRAETGSSRLEKAAQIRAAALARMNALPEAAQSANGDETGVPSFGGSFSKGLAHSRLGLPDPDSYRAYIAAVKSGTLAAYESVPMGGAARFACPLGAHTFDYQGLDVCQFAVPPAPALASSAHAADMVEVYFRALSRDVPYTEFASRPITQAAARNLARMSGYRGPDPASALFRGNTPGDLAGPAISQFLWQTIPFGSSPLPQRWQTLRHETEYLTGFDEWLAVANGATRFAPAAYREQARYIVTPRDLATYVWKDFSYQAFVNAGLILLGWGGAVASPLNPYRTARAQSGFVNFGGPMVLDFVARAANAALRATWFQKWDVHRRLRPEETAARLHAGAISVHPELSRNEVLDAMRERHGGILLPMGYPEGCPLHPSYPGGHSAIAGACVTVLKMLFNESAPIPAPVVPDESGQALRLWTGAPLTVGGELDKLASNMTFGRDDAGVHYRTDGLAGIRLGEQVALSMLRDLFPTLPEGVAPARLA